MVRATFQIYLLFDWQLTLSIIITFFNRAADFGRLFFSSPTYAINTQTFVLSCRALKRIFVLYPYSANTMKKSFLLFLSLLLTSAVMAQNVNYKVLHDGAPQPRLNVNLEYMSLDMGVSNLDGTSFNLGLFGFFEPVSGLGAQFNIKKAYLTLGKLGYKDYPGNLDMSLGGYLMLSNRSVKKPTRVILKREYKGSEFSTNVMGDRVEKRTEEITFITVPATRTIQRGLRGGLYLKRGPFNAEDVEIGDLTSPIDEMGLTSMGVYAGVTSRNLKNIFLNTSTNGVQYNSIGDDFALDVLFVPVNVFRDLNDENANVSQEVKSALGKLPLGFRIGWYRYQIEQKARTGKKFGGSMSFEAGYRPYQGFFINAGLGLTLIKK